MQWFPCTLAATSLSTLAFASAASPFSSATVRAAGAPAEQPEATFAARHDGVPVLRVDLAPQTAVHPLTGAPLQEPHELWHPVCAGDHAMSFEELSNAVKRHKILIAAQSHVLVDSSPHGVPGGGLDLVFVASGSIPAGAPAALAAAEAYLEGIFTADPITVTINVSFQVLSPGVLGGTGSSSGFVNYSGTRALLVGNLDATDTLQSFLPAGTTFPVRYSSSATVTNETRVFFNFANYKALGGTVTGADANMTFNSSFAFDYDPSNGVGSTYSFQDVVIHETGHALGFTSGGDFRFQDSEVLDLYRFQRTDGAADYNPDTTAEFQIRPRLVAFNTPNDAHNSDLISVEYRMADGSPYQMSHLREQSPNIGLMDPALAPGETWFPNFFSTADVALFDAIGYDK